ncbi:MAG: hypothetical protein ISS47_02560 [Candidatus Omnitrophica bacterium]|nr:hypothetical protein [Candidatus Omnitrophota bacterium]
MYIPERSIIDNDKVKLCDELNKILKEQKVIDIASGYFNIGGFGLIKDGLKKIKEFRLLLGKAPERDDSKEETSELNAFYTSTIKESIEEEDFVKERQSTANSLIKFLKQDNVEVRLFSGRFLHGKAYIFDKLVITGSSNFTHSGLTANTELNAVLTDVYADYVRKEWFEKFWNQAHDFKEDLIKILEESKFGKPRIPYDIYIKSLYELQKEDILTGIESKREDFLQTKVELTEFQEDAVRRVFSRIKKYNGVLVADSVGLGKTWIAKRVIEEFGFFRRKNFLVVCPAQLKESMWVKELKDIGLSENIISQESLGREDFDFNSVYKLEQVALIVIDESHNFRSPISNRYEKLFTLIEKATTKTNTPKIMLLTATPINNTVWDLFWQLMLISRNDKRIFIKDGIYDLADYFKEMDKKGTPSMLNDILHEISIRRTRQYIRKQYPDSTIAGEKIIFPERDLKTLHYKLNDSYRGMYGIISDKIEQELLMAYYKLENYRVVGKKDEFEIGRMEALGAIFKTVLLKRLESSVEAFRKSLRNQIKFLKHFRDFLKQGKILRKQYFNKFIDYFDETEEISDADLEKEIYKNLEEINLAEYDNDTLFTEIDTDIKIMEELFEKVETIKVQEDAKLVELKKKLLEIKPEGKVLLFTFYTDTLNYIFNSLTSDKDFMAKFKEKIDKIEGSLSIKQRIEKVDGFLAGDTYLLISTDLLSEGQNLQIAKSLINYDLHWNPTRMIQRAGRIDRIGSPYDLIKVYNFFPEDELETLLNLVKILQRKIRNIDQSVGLDASVLGEVINPKVFGVLKDIESERQSIWDDIEREQFGGGEVFWEPLRDFIKERSFEYLNSIPYGAYSGLKKNFRGIFFYYKYADDYHLWYLYDILKDKFLTHKSEILEFISCKKEEPIFVQESDKGIAFSLHKKIVEDIKEVFYENIIDTTVRTTQKEKFIRDMIEELEYLKKEYFSEYDQANFYIKGIDEIITKLNEISFTKRRTKDLRKIWRRYKENKNPRVFMRELMEFSQEKKILVQESEEEFDEKKLKLVCVDYIS